MNKYVINETTLTAIGDAIREKNGTTEPIPVTELAAAITNLSIASGDMEFTDEQMCFMGNCGYLFYNPMIQELIFVPNKHRIKIITEYTMDHTFAQCKETDLSMVIVDSNRLKNNAEYLPSLKGTFSSSKIQKFPTFLRKDSSRQLRAGSLTEAFSGCWHMRELPDFLYEVKRGTSTDSCHCDGIFRNCYSLRSFGTFDLSQLYGRGSTVDSSGNWIINGYPITSQGFTRCATLEEIRNIAFGPCEVPNDLTTGFVFKNTVDECYRLSAFTFADNCSGYFVREVLDFSKYVGWGDPLYCTNLILNYSSGITADKEVTNAETYQALKNDPDWFTTAIAYSRYNRTSAVETINSLPDTRLYGTNIIKFKGNAGSKTDGGAINTMTAEEIAVATAKGWTVTFV